MSEEKVTLAAPIHPDGDSFTLDQINFTGPIELVDSSEIYPFSGKIKGTDQDKEVEFSNPFDVPDADDPDMKDLRNGIEEYGIMVPLIVRKREAGSYELLSGYRRKKVVDSINAERREKSENEMKVPILVVSNCDDDKAVIILTTSNTYRKNFTLRERIKSCGLAYRAMRHQGKGTQTGKSTAEIVADMFNVKPKTVLRYSALLNLDDELLKIIGDETARRDNGTKTRYRNKDGKLRLSKRAGEELSTLSKSQQKILIQFLQDDDETAITIPLAGFIRREFKKNPDLTLEELKKFIADWKQLYASKSLSEANIHDNHLSFNDLQSYFPGETSQGIVNKICSMLNKWKEAGSPEDFEIKSFNAD